MSGCMFGSTCYTDKRQRRKGRAVLYTVTYMYPYSWFGYIDVNIIVMSPLR